MDGWRACPAHHLACSTHLLPLGLQSCLQSVYSTKERAGVGDDADKVGCRTLPLRHSPQTRPRCPPKLFLIIASISLAGHLLRTRILLNKSSEAL